MGHESSSPVDHSMSRSTDGQMETVRARFLAAWKSVDSGSGRPHLQDFLTAVPLAERDTVFCALLALELQIRLGNGEQPCPADYEAQFPEATELIRSVFEGSGLGYRGTPLATSGNGSGNQRLLGDGEPVGGPTIPAPTLPWHMESPGIEPRPEEGKNRSGPSELPSVKGYEVLEKLGEGGMGIVYKARHLQLQRLVALKMISPRYALSPRMLDLFLVEAAAVARFQHPNLVQIFDIGKHEGQPYLSLELLEGGNLARKLGGTPQPAAMAAALLETLANAVGYAHQKGIVHRDLKPGNILLTADRNPIPKITDFGLAKQLDQDTEAGERAIVGTPAYMSPEQAWGLSDQVGPEADIYSLGVILYEVLTGRPPFKASSHGETVELVRTQEPVPPRNLVPQVPRDLELICLKCLRKDPSQRFPSAPEFAEELRRFQEGRPIQTRPAPLWEKTWKWARRQPALASLIAVGVVALLSLVLYLDQRARFVQRELVEQKRVSNMRDQVQQLHLKAQEAADKGSLQDAQGALQGAFEMIFAEPHLADLKPSLDELQTEVARRALEQTEEKKAKDDHDHFFRLRDLALFHGMVFTGVDLPVNLAAAKKACQEALALYTVTLDPPTGPIFSKYVSEKQRQQCLAACYELLLVWAEAEKHPDPGNRAPTPLQLEKALQILDRAARLDVPSTMAYHLRRASLLEQMGRAEEARLERQVAARSKLKGALDHFLTADGLQKQGKLSEAAKEFANALQAQPDHFWARYFLAVCNLQLQRPDRARDNLTACLTARDDFLWLYVFRGFANGQLNDFPAAAADFEKALALNPDPQALYGIRVYQGVLSMRQAKLFENLLLLPGPHPWATPLEILLRGVAEGQRGQKLAAAEGFLKEAVVKRADQYPAYRYLALLAQQQKRPEEAVTLLDQAVEAAQHGDLVARSQLHGQRARLYREQLDLDAALKDFGLALESFPAAEDHADRGRIRFAQKNYQEALVDFEAALRLRPDEADYYRWQAEALLALNREREAATALDHYLAKGGRPTPEVYRSRGMIRARLRQFPAALADYTQALALQPDSPTHAARAWLFLANDVPSLALKDFEESIRLDGKNGEAYAGRGLIRVRNGKIKEALTDAESAARHGPETARLLWNISHIYAQIVGRLAADPAEKTNEQRRLLSLYVNEGVKVLRQALETLPAPERPAFWQQYIARDAFLNPIRNSDGFFALEMEYGGRKGEGGEK